MLSDEVEAVHLCQHGDIRGLESLVARYQQPAIRFAYLLTGDTFWAEDIVQESFLIVYRTIGSYRPERPFAPWLYGIVANVARNFLRRTGNRHEVSFSSIVNVLEVIDSTPGPQEQAEHGEIHHAIVRALGTLPNKQREAVVLRYYFGFKDIEIAQITGCRPGAARERLHAGRRTFITVIREQYPWLLQEHASNPMSVALQEEIHDPIQ